MDAWRICRRRYSEEAATGEGARRYGGRWNSRGVRLVYASTSLSLAAVETFVNLEPGVTPADLVSVHLVIPDQIRTAKLDVRVLPTGWRESRDERLQRTGNDWIVSQSTAVLLGPSAAIKGEWNLLLNPMHHDFTTIQFGKPEPFEFDARMLANRIG